MKLVSDVYLMQVQINKNNNFEIILQTCHNVNIPKSQIIYAKSSAMQIYK